MSLGHGSSIVRNGLILNLDAANTKSYPGSGTAWKDLSKTNSDSTLQNSPTYSSLNSGSFSLDGIDDRILVPCSASTVRNYNSTVHFVIKLPVYSGGQRCILSYRSGGGGDLYIGKSSNGIFCYYNQLSTAAYTVGNIASNAIVICSVTCDAANNKLSTYINGNLAGSADRTGWSTGYYSQLYLGYDAGGTNEYMLGNFYHFAHYNRVLSATEIRQNFEALRGRYGI